MTDDDPLDLAAVAQDHEAIELVRRRLLADVGFELDDTADSDAAVLLLRDLLRDVEDGLPERVPSPGRRGSTIVSIAGEHSTERQLARRGALVAAVAAGLVSLGGVAAASTLVPAGAPLHGLGEAVRSAADVVVGAVSLPERAASPPTGAAGGAEAARILAPGSGVSATARSQAAARQVTALLDAAQQLLADGRTGPAAARLDNAERRLSDVLPPAAAPLAARLEKLRQEVAAAAAGHGTPASVDRQQEPVQPRPAKQRPAESGPAKSGPAKQDGPKPRAPKQERSQREPAGQERPKQQPSPREAPADSPGGGKAGPRSATAADERAPQLRDRPAQLSRDASTKPRA